MTTIASRRAGLARRWPQVLLTVLILGAGAPAASAVEPSASVAPQRVEFPTTQSLAYRLDLRAGEQPERLVVVPRPGPSFAAPELGRAGEGSAFGRTGFRVDGDVQVESFSSSVFAEVQRCGRHVSQHGEFTGPPLVEVSLPPHGRGSVTYDAPLIARPAWSAADYAFAFELHPRNEDGGETSAPPLRVAAPLPEVAGRLGVKIVMQATRTTLLTLLDGRPLPELRGGEAIDLRGTTRPAVAGELLTLRAARDDGPAEVIGYARVDAGGNFSHLDWQPASPGRYEVWATYGSTRADLADDYMCPLHFRLASPGPPADRLRVTSGPSPRTGPSVALRLACPRAQAACRGTLRARRVGRGVGRPRRLGPRRTFRVHAGRPETVRVRLPRSGGGGRTLVEVHERGARRTVALPAP